MENKLIVINNNSEKDKVNNIKKQVYTSFDIYLEKLYNKGILFFSFTGVKIYPQEITKEDLEYLNKKETLDNLIKDITSLLVVQIEMLEISYISVEQHKNGIPHLYGIIGIRSLIGKNDKIVIELKTFFFKYYKNLRMDALIEFKDIFKFFNYVIKEHNYEKHYLTFYNNKQNTEEHGLLLDYLINLDLEEKININEYQSRSGSIKGFGNAKEDSLKNKIIYLLGIYFDLNDLIVFNGKIFQKELNSNHTWLFHSKLDYIKEEYETICLFLKKAFPTHLKYVDLYSWMILELNSVYEMIKNNPKLLPNSNIDYNVIEFKDGLYFINFDYFYSFHIHKEKHLNLKAYKYFNCHYNYLKKPNLWLSLISKNTQFNTKENLIKFCANLGGYFHTSSIVDFKQKIIYLIGILNIGKSILITNILIEATGLGNIGNITKSKEFAFEEIQNKLLILCDEFKYPEPLREEFFKGINAEPIKINKKNEFHSALLVNNAPLLFISNQIENRILEDQAFLNRLILDTFDYVITNADINLSFKLRKELPKIIIYCNKLYFKEENVKKTLNRALIRRCKKAVKVYLSNHSN